MHTLTATHSIPRRTRTAFHPLKWLTAAMATHHQRIRLQDLDAHLLEDIGLDRMAATVEARRAFWDLH